MASQEKPTVLGEGSFGCVVSPSLSCKGKAKTKSNRPLISKLMTKRHAKKEMEEFVNIDRVDPTFKYHVKTPQMCDVDPAEIMRSKKTFAEDCTKIGEELTQNPTEFAHLIMPNGGENVEDYCESLMEKAKKQNISSEIFTLLRSFTDVMEAVALFEAKKFVMFDLKPGNIVYDILKARQFVW